MRKFGSFAAGFCLVLLCFAALFGELSDVLVRVIHGGAYDVESERAASLYKTKVVSHQGVPPVGKRVLRRNVYRIDNGEDQALRNGPTIEFQGENNDEKDSDIHHEDYHYWTRVLQDDESPMSNASPAPLPTPAPSPPPIEPPPPPPVPPTQSSLCTTYGRWISGCNPNGSSWFKGSSTSSSRGSSRWGSSRSSWWSSRQQPSYSTRDGNSPSHRSTALHWFRHKTSQYHSNKGLHHRISSAFRGYHGKRALQESSANDGLPSDSSRRQFTENPTVLEKTAVTSKLAHQEQGKSDSMQRRNLDFFVAGFSKCGTTTLLRQFQNNEATSFGEKESCLFGAKRVLDDAAYEALDGDIAALDTDPSLKIGLKCPNGLQSYHALDRLKTHSPEARLIVGVRHPVKFFESYYNYRVTEWYDKGRTERIPAPNELLGSKQWRGVSATNARFELFLMQLGKVALNQTEFQDLASQQHLAVVPSSFKVFLYSLEQLGDSNVEREEAFREEMQHFLELEKPIDAFGHMNKNYFVGDNAHPETIDLCEKQYDDVRTILLEQGKKTQEWISTKFIASQDVFVGNQDHFESLLHSWGTDPCRSRDPAALQLSTQTQT